MYMDGQDGGSLVHVARDRGWNRSLRSSSSQPLPAQRWHSTYPPQPSSRFLSAFRSAREALSRVLQNPGSSFNRNFIGRNVVERTIAIYPDRVVELNSAIHETIGEKYPVPEVPEISYGLTDYDPAP